MNIKKNLFDNYLTQNIRGKKTRLNLVEVFFRSNFKNMDKEKV